MVISTKLCSLSLKNPLILASGILGVTKASLCNVVQNGAGAVTIKSVSKEERKGHNSPIIVTYEAGMLNAVGYSNPGLECAKNEFKDLKEVGVPVIASIIGSTADDFSYMAKHFLSKEFSAVELPLSCPHTPGFGILAGQGTVEATREITRAVKRNTRLPVFVKLSPNIQEIGNIAVAAQNAGADAVTVGNTLGPGMVIDITTRKPVLDFKFGGISGPALRPIAVRCVYDVFEAVRIPVIGVGGVMTGRDAIEMIMAGASAVGIGSAVYYRGIDVFKKIAAEMEQFMDEQGYSSIKEIVGVSHEA
ncbi:MAG: dihydroorotate dehydrogenase [Candidatus Woesearchaeota archaeon]